MTLVVDSGSTKTTWAEIESGNKFVTDGLNPHFNTDAMVMKKCADVRRYFNIENSSTKIFFYGAGCGDTIQASRLQSLLQSAFKTEDVSIDTDMLGACRSANINGSSLVGILGTGSNACYYEDDRIAMKSPSLGYILGDEGSANHVGRIMLKKYLNDDLDKELKNLFHDDYPYSYEEWMHRIYHCGNANRFLASLATFVVKHQDKKECEGIIHDVLEEWLSSQLCYLISRTHCKKLYVIGGFAKAIEQTLKEIITNHGIEITNVVGNPIDGLMKYHSSKNS